MTKIYSAVVTDLQAASFLGVAPQTLRNWRSARKGPAYLKMGRSVRYRIEDLSRYMETKRIDPER